MPIAQLLPLEFRNQIISRSAPNYIKFTETFIEVRWTETDEGELIQPHLLYISGECCENKFHLTLQLITKIRRFYRQKSIHTSLLNDSETYFESLDGRIYDCFGSDPCPPPDFDTRITLNELEGIIDSWVALSDENYGIKQDFILFDVDFDNCRNPTNDHCPPGYTLSFDDSGNAECLDSNGCTIDEYFDREAGRCRTKPPVVSPPENIAVQVRHDWRMVLLKSFKYSYPPLDPRFKCDPVFEYEGYPYAEGRFYDGTYNLYHSISDRFISTLPWNVYIESTNPEAESHSCYPSYSTRVGIEVDGNRSSSREIYSWSPGWYGDATQDGAVVYLFGPLEVNIYDDNGNLLSSTKIPARVPPEISYSPPSVPGNCTYCISGSIEVSANLPITLPKYKISNTLSVKLASVQLPPYCFKAPDSNEELLSITTRVVNDALVVVGDMAFDAALTAVFPGVGKIAGEFLDFTPQIKVTKNCS